MEDQGIAGDQNMIKKDKYTSPIKANNDKTTALCHLSNMESLVDTTSYIVTNCYII